MTATRSVGAVEALQGALPEWATPAVVALTQLGDAWFVIALSALVYWFVDRRAGGVALGTVLGALAVTVGLKALFALPRPATALHLDAAAGYGFPSGHAVAATVGWGLLAIVLDAGTRRGRVLAAAVAVVLVSLSRIALGVHYAVDVIVGVAVGIAYLAVALWLIERDPERAAVAAVALALGALALGGGVDAAGFLGAGLAALGVFRFADVPGRPWGRGEILPATLVAVAVGGVAAVVHDESMAPPLAFALGAFAVGVALAAPLALD